MDVEALANRANETYYKDQLQDSIVLIARALNGHWTSGSLLSRAPSSFDTGTRFEPPKLRSLKEEWAM